MTAAGMGGVALGGCGPAAHEAASPPAPDPLEPLLIEAVALAAAYDRVVAAQSGLARRLGPLADDHRAHAAALAELIGRPAPSPPASAASATATASTSATAAASALASTSAPASATSARSESAAAVGVGDAIAELRVAEQTAQRNAVAACHRAATDRTALIGSIAACRATHTEALR